MKEYDKLVRDNIPDIITEKGKSCKIKRVSGKQLQAYQYEKITEELDEFTEAYGKNDCQGMLEELVDLVTITLSYVKANADIEELKEHANLSDFTRFIQDKASIKGGFIKGYVLLEVDE